MNKKVYRILNIAVLVLASIVSFAQDSLYLEKVVVISRHGLRAPLETYYADLASLSPEGISWDQWSNKGVKGSELTPKGAALENLFGNYFRLWFNKEGFQLQPNEVYFGASSKQRTIATARSFAAGMLPLITVPVHFKQADNGGYGPLDENYLPLFNGQSPKEGMVFDTVAFQEEARRELGELKAPAYGFLENILQYSRSKRAKEKGSKHFNNDVSVQLDFYKQGDNNSVVKLEPVMLGDLNVANRASDAFILLYYEAPELLQASFGRDLSFEDMCQLADVKDQYGSILFTAPIIAVNISHCMLKNVYSEMQCNWHKFTFLCTHDSMIQALLAALRVEEYKLDGTIEANTPIGFKFLIEEWTDSSTCERYVKARLIYQSTKQIQEMQVLDITNPPMSYDLSFTGLEKAANGMYHYNDFINHMEKTLSAYNATARGKNPFAE